MYENEVINHIVSILALCFDFHGNNHFHFNADICEHKSIVLRYVNVIKSFVQNVIPFDKTGLY